MTTIEGTFEEIERFEELAAERYELGIEVEEIISILLRALERYEPIHSEQVACARAFGEGSLIKNPPHALIRAWLVSRLGEYLSASLIEALDRPLPEADGFAAQPRGEGQAVDETGLVPDGQRAGGSAPRSVVAASPPG